MYPAKPKVGLRAYAPNELWHVDVTIIRLLDGTKAYLHAVIDNFSRRILAWTLEERLAAGGTCRILLEAGRCAGEGPPGANEGEPGGDLWRLCRRS